MVELRDIRGPVSLGHDYFWLILFFLLILAAAAFFLFRRRTKQKPKPAAAANPAHVLALEALDRLRAKNLSLEEYYVELSSIVRTYLEARFNIRAPEMTSEEFLLYLVDFPNISDEHKKMLKEFLDHCDMVKFAKYRADDKEMTQSLDYAYKLVRDTTLLETTV
jgi:hypothetical protein